MTFRAPLLGESLNPFLGTLEPALLKELKSLSANSFQYGLEQNTDLMREQVKTKVREKLKGKEQQANYGSLLEQELKAMVFLKTATKKIPSVYPCLFIKSLLISYLQGIYFKQQRVVLGQGLTAAASAECLKELQDPQAAFANHQELGRLSFAQAVAEGWKDGVYDQTRAIETFFIFLNKEASYQHCDQRLHQKLAPYLGSDWQQLIGKYKRSLWSYCDDPFYLHAFQDLLVAELKAELLLQKEEKQHTTREVIYENNCLQYLDPQLKFYPAGKIPNTNFIITPGPHYEASISFIDHILFHESKDYPAVTQIVALGSLHPTKNCDFVDYFGLKDIPAGGGNIILYHNSNKELRYRVRSVVKQRSDEYQVNAQQKQPRGMIEAEVCIDQMDEKGQVKQKRHLHFLGLALLDNHVLDIENEKLYPGLKDLMIGMAEKVQHSSMVVHCRGGVGRSGYWIYSLLLFMNAAKVFASKEAKAILAAGREWLETMRSVRPMAVYVPEQETYAFLNALILNRRLLELQKSMAPKGPAAMFANSEQKAVEKQESAAQYQAALLSIYG